jgi:glutamine amidotransferase
MTAWRAGVPPAPRRAGRPPRTGLCTLIASPFANLANISRALRTIGADLDTTTDAVAVAEATQIILPGVGSFAAAMRWLESNDIDKAIRQAMNNGAKLLGICVGHQLLFERSAEGGDIEGLGLIAGSVEKFEGPLPVPQIGWNRVVANGPLFEDIENEAFYFVNSYAVRSAPDEIARADYGGAFTAGVQRERVFGVQFHPEKSSRAGLRVLENFLAWN